MVDLLVFEFAGEHGEGSDTSAVTFSNRLEDGLQDSLFGSTEHAEVKDSRQVDKLLSHDRPSKNKLHLVPVDPFIYLVDQPVQALLRCAKHLFVAAMVA